MPLQVLPLPYRTTHEFLRIEFSITGFGYYLATKALSPMRDEWGTKKQKKANTAYRWQFNKDILHYQCYGPNLNIAIDAGTPPPPMVEYYRVHFYLWNENNRGLPMLGDRLLKDTLIHGNYPRHVLPDQVLALGN